MALANPRRHILFGPSPPRAIHSSTSPNPSQSSSSGGTGATTLPAFVSCRKFRIAEVASSSWESSLMVGARGCFYSQALPTLLASGRCLASHGVTLVAPHYIDTNFRTSSNNDNQKIQLFCILCLLLSHGWPTRLGNRPINSRPISLHS